jgi:hypothetical protein
MTYRAGVWKVICQVCDKELYSDECKIRWDGLVVCPNDWEPRHPLDYMRVPKYKESSVPFQSPETGEIDGSPAYAIDTRTAVPAGTFDNEI